MAVFMFRYPICGSFIGASLLVEGLNARAVGGKSGGRDLADQRKCFKKYSTEWEAFGLEELPKMRVKNGRFDGFRLVRKGPKWKSRTKIRKK